MEELLLESSKQAVKWPCLQGYEGKANTEFRSLFSSLLQSKISNNRGRNEFPLSLKEYNLYIRNLLTIKSRKLLEMVL